MTCSLVQISQQVLTNLYRGVARSCRTSCMEVSRVRNRPIIEMRVVSRPSWTSIVANARLKGLVGLTQGFGSDCYAIGS